MSVEPMDTIEPLLMMDPLWSETYWSSFKYF